MNTVRRSSAPAAAPVRPRRRVTLPVPILPSPALAAAVVAASAALCALPGGARAADLHVGPGQAYEDLTGALAAAASGDRVLLHAGTYAGNFRVTRPIELRGVEDGVVLTSSAGSGTVLQLEPGASGTVVAWLAIEGGQGEIGGGASARGGEFRFERVRIRGGEATIGGGGLGCKDATCTLVASTVVRNTSLQDGGGVALLGGELRVQGGVIALNTAQGKGGGAYATDGDSVVVEGARFIANHAEDHAGGGVFVSDSDGVSIAHSRFRHNRSGEMGAGVSLTASDGEVRGNLVEHNESVLDVGGIASMTGVVDVVGNVVRWNRCGVAAGGIYFITTAGGTIRNNLVYANEAGQTGGGILVEAGTGDVFNNVVAYNTSVHGGGGIMMGRGGYGEVAQNTVIGNASGDLNTDGISAIDQSDLLVWNNVVVANEDSGIFGEASREVRVRYNDSWGNGSAAMDYAGEADGAEGTNGNLSLDPAFEHLALTGDLLEDDPRPAPGSPLVDAGDPAVEDPDGTRSDIGAFGGPGGDDWADLPIATGW